MDWDLKMPLTWDLAELEHGGDAESSAGGGGTAGASGIGGAAAGAAAVGRGECSVDLKLGGLGESGGGKAPAPAPVPVPVHAASASASSSKRPRASSGGGGSGQQCPPCAVDGCRADLSKCRDYHRRHKVCEAHSKVPVVAVAGREMRFCQQCSRFHLLTEFDEAKRSCRKRLDGHNRRRRKPQPNTMNSASFIPSQQGARFSSFPTPRQEQQNWAGMIKTEESPYYTHQIPLGISNRQHFVGSTSSTDTKDGRHFPFLQEGEINFAAGVVLGPLLRTTVAPPPPPESSSSSRKMFSDGLITPARDSDCALSLLSAPANSSGVDVGRMVRPASQDIPMAQPLFSGLQFSSSSWLSRSQAAAAAAAAAGSAATGFSSCPAVESEHLNTPVDIGSDNNEMNYGGIFHVGGEGSSDGTPPSLPFAWQ